MHRVVVCKGTHVVLLHPRRWALVLITLPTSRIPYPHLPVDRFSSVVNIQRGGEDLERVEPVKQEDG